MSAKPSAAFSWASAGVRVAASAAKALVGFVPRERPPAQILNDILGQLGEWTQWLFDGDVEFNTLGVLAETTLVGDCQMNSDLNVLGSSQLGLLLGPLTLSGTNVTQGLISDSATHHDFTATGIAEATVLEVVINGVNTPSISSLLAAGTRHLLWLIVTGGDDSNTLTLLHNTGGTAANRFLLPNVTSLTIPQYGAVLLLYNSADTRWRVLGKNF
jgi:hypothetical protein